MDAMDKLTLAIANLEASHPDLHAAIAGLPLEEAEEATSLGSDGKVLAYSREFVDRCDQAQADYLVAFNAQLILDGARERLMDPTTDREAWHLTSNLVVNRKLRQRGIACTIPGAIDDPDQDGLSVDELYAKLGSHLSDGFHRMILDKVAACSAPVGA